MGSAGHQWHGLGLLLKIELTVYFSTATQRLYRGNGMLGSGDNWRVTTPRRALIIRVFNFVALRSLYRP